MDKRIILAKAGSGKTYYICNNLNPINKNLIIAYTNQNISNIVNEVSKAHDGIPNHTEIITFHSFIYRNFIRPYELLFSEKYNCPVFRSKGVSFVVPEPAMIKGKFNSKYHKNNTIKHYYTYNCEQVFLSRMSDLVVKNKEIFLHGISYMKKFFDYFYIDEVQDFRESDWKLLEMIIQELDNVVLVGDFYQHSVSGDNNSGIPFRVNNTLKKYKEYLTKLGLTVDELTLSKSRRCTKKVCEFVSIKTKINIEPFNMSSTSEVREISDREELINLLKDDSVMKLLLRNSHKQYFKAINWGNSKGDTYDAILVVLPSTHKKIFDEDFEISSEISRNKLYVTLTRTRGDLLIVQDEIFKEFNEKIL